MAFLAFGILLYFLPSLLGHDKRDALGIFFLNLLLGWTVIGWIAAMVWACAGEVRSPVLVVAGYGRYCQRCDAPSIPAAHYCSACGRPI